MKLKKEDKTEIIRKLYEVDNGVRRAARIYGGNKREMQTIRDLYNEQGIEILKSKETTHYQPEFKSEGITRIKNGESTHRISISLGKNISLIFSWLKNMIK